MNPSSNHNMTLRAFCMSAVTAYKDACLSSDHATLTNFIRHEVFNWFVYANHGWPWERVKVDLTSVWNELNAKENNR
jgi:hypothetical protein